MPFHNTVDTQRDFFTKLRINATPTFVLFHNGKIISYLVGFSHKNQELLRKAIENLLSFPNTRLLFFTDLPLGDSSQTSLLTICLFATLCAPSPMHTSRTLPRPFFDTPLLSLALLAPSKRCNASTHKEKALLDPLLEHPLSWASSQKRALDAFADPRIARATIHTPIVSEATMTMQLGATNIPLRPFSSSRSLSPEHKSPALPTLLLKHTTKDSFLLCLKHARHAGDYSERTLLTYHHWCVRFWDALQKQRLIAPASADQPAGFQSLCDLFLQKLQQDLRSPSSIAQARAALSFLQRLCFPKPSPPSSEPTATRTR